MSLKTTYSQFYWGIRDPGVQGHLSIPCICSWDITLKLMPGLQNYNYLNFSFQCPFQFSINMSMSKSFLYQIEMKSIKCYRLCATQENHTLVPTVKLFETWPKAASIVIHTRLPWQLPKHSAT